MIYVLDDKQYHLSYQELKSLYLQFCECSDEEFLDRLPEVLHLACIVGYLKEFNKTSLADNGIIHQLVHCLHIPNEPLINLKEIREQFKEAIKLC